MTPIGLLVLEVIRSRIYTEFLCPTTEHNWTRVESCAITLFVICETCGRTPLEMLAQLPLPPKETE